MILCSHVPLCAGLSKDSPPPEPELRDVPSGGPPPPQPEGEGQQAPVVPVQPLASTIFVKGVVMLHDAGHLVPFGICRIRICSVFSLFLSVLFREHMKYYIKKVAKHFQNKTDLRFNVNGFHSELTGDFSDWTTSNDVLPYDSSGIPPGAVICNLPRYRLEFLTATY